MYNEGGRPGRPGPKPQLSSKGGNTIVKPARTLFLVVTLFLISMTANAQSSSTPLRGTPIGVGDVAPDFTLEDQDGRKINLSDARGKSPVVLVFYRGYW
jgi:cytochrome oxidase Cu insertion factor (SCO1/SenC/PrrC family)